MRFIHEAYRIVTTVLALLLAVPGCTSGDRPAGRSGNRVLVFKHGKIEADPAVFDRILRRFERDHPGILVKDETLPASTDEQHQFYVINLEGRSTDIDVLSMDVIWVPEFARAGWLRDLSGLLDEEERKNGFFPGPLEAVTYNGALYAVPWYIDAGMLYYRADLLRKYGLPPPRTWHQLAGTARKIMVQERGLHGFIWQGKQYEGLVCNALEFFWSNGGGVLKDGMPVIDSSENSAALAFMRDLIDAYRVTPPLVLTATEEPTRHIFGSGKALFMRNWPYAWTIFQRPGSVVRGRIGVTTLPSFPGHPSAAVLGGWQLGVNRFSRSPQAAEQLVRYLTSAEIGKELTLAIGYNPARTSLYRDADLVRIYPIMPQLYEVFMTARPRPVTPYYMMITQVLQPELSAAITGIKTPEEALATAQKQVANILEVGQ